ncbi:methylamine dehydrogenase accessory protein MauD [Gluconacetobacter johannae DSM 13595]|uniref:Conjugal transfer protein TraF n=1 Tax=Gluconacetobacter johannae TaxID=112140 RepID=A0A7W4J5W5_9PROT|nr:redoxin domain-containing protein [Gluconacetobacter johannae]MBB2175239.1 conjugal transfer protein TraF [Gluconacetobacter johannae]GBQ80768.1 methylamine dehydrogenase accessory protein MauD [Gluconacetobacter johannae DSM 13595]
MMVTSNFLLWVVCALLTVAVVALARQIGVLHERIAPMGALVTDGGPKVGAVAPRLTLTAMDGAVVEIAPGEMGARAVLLMFVASDCPVCAKIIPIVRATAQSERLKLFFVGDDGEAAIGKMIARYGLEPASVINSAAPGLAFHVGKLPYGVLLRPDGTIASKGLLNTREHVESLVVADETGFASAQDYIRSLHPSPNAA